MILRYTILFLFNIVLIGCGENNSIDTDNLNSNTLNVSSESEDKSKNTPVIDGTPTTIKGMVSGMDSGKKIFFDRKTLDASDVMSTTTLDNNGNFELITGIQTSGIYRVRLGARPIWMLLKGGENIEITATMDGYKIKNYNLTGAMYAEEMKKWTKDPDIVKIRKYLTKSKETKPLLHLYLVLKLDMASNLDLYKKVLVELQKSFPNDTYTRQFTSKVMTMEAKIKSQPLSVGSKAPEINLPNPNGKKISLSSLRGKVVLLDFWASWCRPCRMANPHVVSLYEKYNKKGFDVFNVSLDGIDDKRAAMYQNNPKAIAQATEIEKGKWKQAIKTDKLRWKNHVSQLRGWSSPVAGLYKVSSIPKTYLLDQKGIIRYENLRGQALEDAIKVLLSE
ncbi:MAG: TlpA family protein disulfide reductase [Saprospiraceae bacterium]|nr:TlpA family protein disulfide reductase [Saprospiraceae bacterium]